MSVAILLKAYLTKVVPPEASEIQIAETTKAFYAGGMALLTLIKELDPQNPTEGFMALENELLTFSASIGAQDATIN